MASSAFLSEVGDSGSRSMGAPLQPLEGRTAAAAPVSRDRQLWAERRMKLRVLRPAERALNRIRQPQGGGVKRRLSHAVNP